MVANRSMSPVLKYRISVELAMRFQSTNFDKSRI